MAADKAVKRLRRELCMGLGEFAKLIPVTLGTVHHWETNIRTPRHIHMRKMLEIAKQHNIKLTVKDFFD